MLDLQFLSCKLPWTLIFRMSVLPGCHGSRSRLMALLWMRYARHSSKPNTACKAEKTVVKARRFHWMVLKIAFTFLFVRDTRFLWLLGLVWLTTCWGWSFTKIGIRTYWYFLTLSGLFIITAWWWQGRRQWRQGWRILVFFLLYVHFRSVILDELEWRSSLY